MAVTPTKQHYPTIIVGAGPAGLQLAYFLQRAGLDYLVLERAPAAASFFDSYPHSGKLISINKPHTGSDVYDFNLRHDWNSLLNDEKMSFTDYSKEYYPDKNDLVRYMNDYAKRFKLAISYNSVVQKISKGYTTGTADAPEGYTLRVSDLSGSTLYTCDKLVVATGLSKPQMPEYIDNTTVKPKHYADYPKGYFQNPANLDTFRNKSLCIIGNGNSAFELGNILTPYCSSITIHGRKPKPWAASTHYTGDLRSVYLPFYDTFLLKSLNAMNNEVFRVLIDQPSKQDLYKMSLICSPNCMVKHDFISSKTGFDHVIFATGWTFDTTPFEFEVPLTAHGKFPAIQSNYESVTHKNLFFIGALMHSLDYKASSGGFIHGFRYLIEYFFHLNYDKVVDTDIFSGTKSFESLIDHILYKINYTSAMYQMYGVIGDVFFYNAAKKEFAYFNNVTKSFVNGLAKRYMNTKLFLIKLQYGDEPVTDIYKFGLKVSKLGTESNSTLLHPVLYVMETPSKEGTSDQPPINLIDMIHFDEEIFAVYTDKVKYRDKLMRAIKGVVEK